MLVLRRGIVVRAGPADAPEQRLVVDVPGRGERAAIADVTLVGPAHEGDEVVVNAQAADLGLGSGGFDIVHVNLTRGLDGAGVPGAHVMKLNYTSLQHAVLPVEGPDLHVAARAPRRGRLTPRAARAAGVGARAGPSRDAPGLRADGRRGAARRPFACRRASCASAGCSLGT